MNNPLSFYKTLKSELEKESADLQKKLVNLAFIRFTIFIATCFGVYLFWVNYSIAIIIGLFGFGIFTFLVFKYINVKREKAIVDEKININKIEIDVLERKFYHLDPGNEFKNPNHFYSNDVDLFGKGSFFQYLNRTTTFNGKKKLSMLLTENEIRNILEKQEVLKDLSEKVKWRQHFSALAKLVNTHKNTDEITKWITNYSSVFTNNLSKIQLVFSAISLGLIFGVSFGFISFNYILAWFFLGLMITGKFLKKTSKIYAKTSNSSHVFKQYHLLLNEIENAKFSSKILVDKQQIIQSENEKASTIFKKFTKILDAFDNRNNIIIAVFGNGLFLWEVLNAVRIEKWIKNYSHTVEHWFKVVAFFDAQNALANFVFNHPDFVFPKITKGETVIDSEDLGHPLLDKNKRVDNNFKVNDKEFFIVTGANMAGKSTFLRTVSLSIIMANCGLPVCAKRFEYSPIKLITSMRTSDSLTEDESYFYAELKRLKFIVNQIKTEDYFIILDEILKGTNSKDKATGSKQFVEKLTTSKSTGIIATHDVSLCELEKEFATIKNYYFDAIIKNNELFFDYTFKSGICKNMNASFLLKKMEIV